MEDNSANLAREIRSLLAEGRKIEAIKQYRQATGVGLAEAKDAVDRLEQGDLLPPTKPADSALEPEIVSLLGRGQKIEAIKIYRERTGSGLKEAKEAVDAIGSKHGISAPTGSGCLGVFVLVTVVLAGTTFVFVAMKF